jgi:diguanylate cyclase (GGDEF)-like protein
MRSGREAVLFVLLTPLLMFLSVSLEQVDPHVPGKFAFLVLLGPTLLVALTGKRWQGLTTAVISGLGCVVSGWVGSGMHFESLSTTTMSMPVLLGAALLSVGTMLTLRCDESERRISDLDNAVARVVSAEKIEHLVEAILDATATLIPDHTVELYIWEPREQGFVPTGARNGLRPMCAVPLFGGLVKEGTALAPTMQDWTYLDRELDRSQGSEHRLPLTSGDDEVFGFLRFESRTAPSSDINHLLQIVASFSGLAIKNVLLFERLREQARRDGLTGLVNYAAFQDELSRTLHETADSSSSTALVLMDLDKFKQVNDRYGHHVGSQMLQTLADLWRRVLPPDASLARYGGDEFACILRNSGAAEILAHIKVLKRTLADNPVRAGDARIAIEPSIGIALYPADARNADDLFHAADAALYAAKRKGGGLVCMTGDDAIAVVGTPNATTSGDDTTKLPVWRSDTRPLATGERTDGCVEPALILPLSASNG